MHVSLKNCVVFITVFQQKPVVFQKLFKGHTDGRLGLAAMETALAMERYSHDLILQTMDKIDKGSVHDPHVSSHLFIYLCA